MAKRKVWTTVVVLFILVGLPAVSFLYLRNGADYRRSAIESMGDFGQMPSIQQLQAVRGDFPADPRGAMTVVGWLDPTKEAGTRVYGNMLDSLYQQFKDSPNLYFTTIVLADQAGEAADNFATQYNLPEDPMLSFLRADERQFATLAEDFRLPLGTYDSPGIQPIVALVDSSLTIVEHYDLARRDDAVGLVQLISLIIPLPAKQDIILDRGNEL